MAKKQTADVDGVILQAPEGCTSCSHDGVTYECEADGLVIVPAEAVPELMSHGFAVPKAAPAKGGK